MKNQLGIDIANAWIEASKDLGVKIKTPFRLQLDRDNFIECILLVEDFGSNLGTMVFVESDWLGNKQIESSGYGISTLSDSYQKYERDSFIDMLNDWGYFGDESKKPEWYTGEPWSK